MQSLNTHQAVAASVAAQLLARRPIFIDTETTGLGRSAQICELALIDTDGTVLVADLLRPTVPIEDGAAQVHGITNQAVAAAPTFGQLWLRLAPLLQGRELVSYNWDFDERMLDQTAAAYNMRLNLTGHCAMLLFATYAGEKRYPKAQHYQWHKLADAARRCALEPDGRLHRAVADADLCRRLVHHMAAQQIRQSV